MCLIRTNYRFELLDIMTSINLYLLFIWKPCTIHIIYKVWCQTDTKYSHIQHILRWLKRIKRKTILQRKEEFFLQKQLSLSSVFTSLISILLMIRSMSWHIYYEYFINFMPYFCTLNNDNIFINCSTALYIFILHIFTNNSALPKLCCDIPFLAIPFHLQSKTNYIS